MEPTETCRITRYSVVVLSKPLLPSSKHLFTPGSELSSDALNWVLSAGLPNPDSTGALPKCWVSYKISDMGEQFSSLFGQVLGIKAVLLSLQGRNVRYSQWWVRAAGEVLVVSKSWIPVSRQKNI